MIKMQIDSRKLTDKKIPLKDRIHIFNKIIEKFGTLNEHRLSHLLNINPQIIIAFYELNTLDDDEIKFLDEKNLDFGVVSCLMNIQKDIRKYVYKKLDYFLNFDEPIKHIVEYINEENWIMNIYNLYKKIDRKFWGELASYLKDMNIKKGPINKKFRAMLVSIKKYDASESQLQWLERCIIYDMQEELGIFKADTFKERFPKAVNTIEQFLCDKKLLENK